MRYAVTTSVAFQAVKVSHRSISGVPAMLPTSRAEFDCISSATSSALPNAVKLACLRPYT